jgi:hypothetical protein
MEVIDEGLLKRKRPLRWGYCIVVELQGFDSNPNLLRDL